MLSMDAINYEWARRKVAELVFRLQRMLARGVVLGDDPRGKR